MRFWSAKQTLRSILVCLALAGCEKQEVGPSPQDLIRRQQLRESAALTKSKTLQERLATAEDYLAQGNTVAADKEIQPLLITEHDNPKVIFLLARCEAESGDKVAAAGILESINETDLASHLEALWLAARWLTEAHQYDAAEQKLQRILELSGDVTRVHRKLASILNFQGRRIEAATHLRALARSGDISEKELFAMNTYSDVLIDDSLRQPDFGGKLTPAALVQAKILRSDGQLARARAFVERLAEMYPESTQISAFQGRVYIDLQDEQNLRRWVKATPDEIQREPEYWYTLGIWLRRQNRHREAVRCLAEAVTRDQTDRFSYIALADSLKRLGEHDAAQRATQRFESLSEAAQIAKKLGLEPGTREQLNRMAELLEQLQRPWEAISWRSVALKTHGGTEKERAALRAKRESLAAEKTSDAADHFLSCGLDLAEWPLPSAEEIGSLGSLSPSGKLSQSFPRGSGDIFFEDQAEKRGWIHTCEIAPEAISEGHWIYQAFGGGVGVNDFDLDGWPDLAVAMLDGQPLKMDSSPNRLFRNLDGRFVDCTVQSNYLDKGFSQGITVGDFNDDGFPDIFDANIGRNRLFRNNGDGTFAEVSVQTGMSGEIWTTSAVLVDIDGDGFADIYETAYCSGRKPYEKPCRNSIGNFACDPLDFPAEKDRLWRGTGDGTFVDVTDQWMNQSTPGRGLGVLVGLFDERHGLDLFIANDMSVNHLWSGESVDSEFRLTDVGAIRGVGLSGHSTSQASMGMTAGDPDGDGDIDFFLTHFADDYNTYYEQVGPGLWTDRSFQIGLAEPSRKLLGFGTEWTDFDNNGTLELIVANGHVNKKVNSGDLILYRMPTQLFQLGASGGWVELERKNLGGYFSGDHLGRALVTLDVDRDGRTDVAITHLYDPVSLLMNRTTKGGQSISLELKSTRGQRDAIGATVTATVGAREVRTQLTAGDGYMCSNQRRITLGTGSHIEANDLAVIWPSGAREEFGTLATGRDYSLVEGSGEAYLLRQHQ